MHLPDNWDSGSDYERYVGRWSGPVAHGFIRWLDPPPKAVWLDVGCGTGALSAQIAADADPVRVDGIDPSPAFVEQAARRLPGPHFSFAVGNALDISHPDHTYDLVVSGLVLTFIPDIPAGLREMRRVAKPGGTVAAYVWDYAGEMQMMRFFWDAARELRPSDAHLDEGIRFPIARPEALEELFAGAGLTEVETSAVDIPTHFTDFSDYWEPFLGGTGTAPTYLASLSPVERDAIRDLVRDRLPFEDDGSIELMARAWTVRGTVPS